MSNGMKIEQPPLEGFMSRKPASAASIIAAATADAARIHIGTPQPLHQRAPIVGLSGRGGAVPAADRTDHPEAGNLTDLADDAGDDE